MQDNNIINEDFVDELCKSRVWDTARVEVGLVTENSTADTDNSEDVLTARDLALELLENLDDDVIFECVNLLHAAALDEANEEGGVNEDTLNEEEANLIFEEAMDELDDEELEEIMVETLEYLEEEYDLSDLNEEDLLEAAIDELKIKFLQEKFEVAV